ncbi:MAG: hypothetical protein AAGB93_09840 [Planctomycetota bacterium]
MKTTLLVLAASTLTLAQRATANDDACVLLAAGDALEGGRTVVRIRDVDIDDAGRWAARVEARRGQDPVHTVLVVDGQVVMEPGDPLSSGDVVVAVFETRLVEGGRTLSGCYGGATGDIFTATTRLVLDDRTVLAEGDPVPAPSLPAGVRVDRVHHAEVAGVHVVASCVLAMPTGDLVDALLSYVIAGSDLASPRVLARRLTAPGGLTRPIDEFLPSMAVTSDGTYVATLTQLAAADDVTAGLYDGAAAFESGSQAPAGAGTWESISPRVACARGVGYVVSGALEAATGPARGIVATETAVVALAGAPLAASPGDVVGTFHGTEVEIAESGEIFFGVPVEGGGDVLVAGDEVLVRTGAALSNGSALEGLPFGSFGSLAISRTGSRVLFVGIADGGGDALVLVEREAGAPDGCVAVENSTGAVGELRALGSRYVAMNALRVRASSLPSHAFGLLLTSRAAGFVANPAGSSGNLCLGGAIGAFPSTVRSDAGGGVSIPVDLGALPQPLGQVAASAGETWRFQLLHRDAVPTGGATTNFTSSVAVTLR